MWLTFFCVKRYILTFKASITSLDTSDIRWSVHFASVNFHCTFTLFPALAINIIWLPKLLEVFADGYTVFLTNLCSRYKRVFSVGTHGITTYNPTTLEVTNQVSEYAACLSGDIAFLLSMSHRCSYGCAALWVMVQSFCCFKHLNIQFV